MRKKRRVRKNSLIIFIIVFISFIGLFFSIFNIIKWKLDNNKVKEIQKNIKENIIIDNPIDDKKESILDSYNIDFKELKKINSEIVGYIKVDNTNIDYTIVKHDDNSYYLNHSFDNKWNLAGWIFSHYKNKYDGTDKNYVLFGHSRQDGGMFGTLKNILTEEWQNEDNNIILITENKKYLFKPFSVYKVKAEEYYITTDFKDDEDFKTFTDNIKSRSLKDYNLDIDVNDKILTLSTCYSDDSYRIVLHAKEILEQ